MAPPPRRHQASSMALKSTVVKAELQISDMDRHYYATHDLTLAQHPSETDERLMVRLLAFALYRRRAPGIRPRPQQRRRARPVAQATTPARSSCGSTSASPTRPRIRKACGRARQVVVFNYGGRSGGHLVGEERRVARAPARTSPSSTSRPRRWTSWPRMMRARHAPERADPGRRAAADGRRRQRRPCSPVVRMAAATGCRLHA